MCDGISVKLNRQSLLISLFIYGFLDQLLSINKSYNRTSAYEARTAASPTQRANDVIFLSHIYTIHPICTSFRITLVALDRFRYID